MIEGTAELWIFFVKLNPVSDVAEREVKLIEEYNGSLTKSYEQQHNMLRVVSDYLKKYTKCTKEVLSQPLD